MNKSPPIQESSYYIHQRYEDTSQTIFQQQQKRKKDLAQTKHRHPDDASNEVEFAHYGNPGVIARKEAAARLASYNKEGKSPRKKEDKSSKKEEKSSKKEEKSSKKEDKSSKKEEKSSKRRDSASDKGAHGGRDPVFPEKYTPIESPSLLYVNRSRVLSPRSLPKETSLDLVNDEQSPSPVKTNFSQYTFPYSPTSTEVTSPSQTFSDSPRDTSLEGSALQSPRDTQGFSVSSRETSFGTERGSVSQSPKEKETFSNSPTETSFGTEEGSVLGSPNKTGFSQYTFPYLPNSAEGTSPQEFFNSLRETSFGPEEETVSQSPEEARTLSNSPKETTFGTEEESVVESPIKSGFSPYTFPYEPNTTEVTTSPSQTFASSPKETSLDTEKDSVPRTPKERSYNSGKADIPHSPNGRHLDSDRESSPDLEKEDSFVEYGHYGNTGIYAKKEAVARVASILRKDGKSTKSTVCSVM